MSVLFGRGQRADDGTYRVSGTKIFITFGEHDLAENIIHLVLARTPGAPPGTKGISVFVVPKFLVNADGSLGERNSLACLKVEHKLGIHASPTCVMEFDNAVGNLIGDEGTGMRSMFTMMNNARLSVGLEGVAVSEASYQQSLAYARDRKQGRAISAGPGPSPIVEHVDVRLMLATMKAYIERCGRCSISTPPRSIGRIRIPTPMSALRLATWSPCSPQSARDGAPISGSNSPRLVSRSTAVWFHRGDRCGSTLA